MERERYRVVKQFSHGGLFATKGAVLELAESQATFLSAGGYIESVEKKKGSTRKSTSSGGKKEGDRKPETGGENPEGESVPTDGEEKVEEIDRPAGSGEKTEG